MMKYFALVICVIALIGVLRASDRDKVLGKWIFDRPCPTNIRVKQGFDIEEYIGTWYNIERYQQPFEVGADCITVSYDLQEDGTVDIESWSRFIDNQTETKLKVSGYVSYPLDDPIPGKLNVSFYGHDLGVSSYILDTDYWQYAIVYNCIPFNAKQSYEIYYLFSRNPFYTKNRTIIDHVNRVKRQYIDQNYVINTNQDDNLCFDNARRR